MKGRRNHGYKAIWKMRGSEKGEKDDDALRVKKKRVTNIFEEYGNSKMDKKKVLTNKWLNTNMKTTYKNNYLLQV
jgi:hypothetical protein